MKYLFSLLLLILVNSSFGQLKPSDVEINDSLSIIEKGNRVKSYDSTPDSTNRLAVQCGISDYFKKNLFDLDYKNGVGYLFLGDSMVLFQVDFSSTVNEVEINRLELESGLTLRKFERQIRRCKCKETREEVKVRGVEEIVYTVYKDETGLAYRAFFRDGKLHSLLMYLPCSN